MPPLEAALEVTVRFPSPSNFTILFSLLAKIDLRFRKNRRVLFDRLSDDSRSLVCDSLGVSYPVMIHLSALLLSLSICLGVSGLRNLFNLMLNCCYSIC